MSANMCVLSALCEETCWAEVMGMSEEKVQVVRAGGLDLLQRRADPSLSILDAMMVCSRFTLTYDASSAA